MKTERYYEEYYIGAEYIGKKKCQYQNSREFGYRGKLNHTSTDKILFGKKRILPGQEYTTIYYPLNEGKQ
jgi:hypothetical protein